MPLYITEPEPAFVCYAHPFFSMLSVLDSSPELQICKLYHLGPAILLTMEASLIATVRVGLLTQLKAEYSYKEALSTSK